MRLFPLYLVVVAAVAVVSCSSEPPQYAFDFDVAESGAVPLMPSVLPTFDDALLAQRSVTAADRAAGASPAAPATPTPEEQPPTEDVDVSPPPQEPAATPPAPAANPFALPGRLGGTTPAPGNATLASAPEPAPVAVNSSDAAAAEHADLASQAFAFLQQNCIRCHGDRETRSELDLRTRPTALRGGENGPALVPGDPQQSRMYLQIAHLSEPFMPPRRTLPPASVELVRTWIEAGAPWPAGGGPAPQPTDAGAPSGSGEGAIGGFLRRGIRAIRQGPRGMTGRDIESREDP